MSPSASPAASTAVHFATPQEAMRYLTVAYNKHDRTSLKHVTTPAARDALEAMRTEAVNLRLTRCVANTSRGDYECYFSHGYPAGYKLTGQGQAEFTVGPASKPGWYMTVLQHCG